MALEYHRALVREGPPPPSMEMHRTIGFLRIVDAARASSPDGQANKRAVGKLEEASEQASEQAGGQTSDVQAQRVSGRSKYRASC